MAAYEILLLNTAVPQIQAAQAGDTYVVPRDIAFSAALTLSAGTANGVPYLNGSKVLTSGGALTFDGTNLGIGTSSPTQRLHIQLPTGLTDGIPFRSRTDGGGEFNLVCADTSSATPLWKFQTGTSEDLAFLSGTSERMRLTSTGLGIGTSSPGTKLDVVGQGRVLYNTGATNTGDQSVVTVGAVTSGAYASSYGAGLQFQVTNSSGGYAASRIVSRLGADNNTANLVLQVRNYGYADSLVLDSSGNLTLNSATANGVGYFNGSKVLTTGSALTFDGSQLGVGISPAYTLHVAKTSGYVAAFRGTTAAASGILVGNTAGDTAIQTLASGDSFIFSDTSKYLAFGVNGGSEQMRLTSTGLGIGTSSPSTKLQVEGGAGNAWARFTNTANTSGLYVGTSSGGEAIVYQQGNNYLAFFTNATERARITSGGNFKIGGSADRATTEGDKQLVLFDGTAPVGTLANGISIYSSSGEAYVMDAAGNATLFSPHDAATNEWIFRSKHTPTGKVLKIDVERLLKFVNDHFGLDAVHEFIED